MLKLECQCTGLRKRNIGQVLDTQNHQERLLLVLQQKALNYILAFRLLFFHGHQITLLHLSIHFDLHS